ncbi:MAG: hypothetical protein GXO74_02450 [Calditrichaeota bacterium]|nr:hypothetical protein [Calditrichota bacterium]
MRRFLIFSAAMFIIFPVVILGQSRNFEQPHKFTTEFMFGIRAPMAETRHDVLSGFSLRAGIGYQLNQNWEIAHLSFDFGNSSPHDPEWVSFYDYYTYSSYLQQETVNVYGFPLTTRLRFQLHSQLAGYVGAGVAYYWFRTRLDHPYYGEIKGPRRRHGPGGLFEFGVFTDAFSENVLVGLTANVLYLHTWGETLTTPKADSAAELHKKIYRDDWYLTFGVTLRYFLGTQ